MSIKYSDGLAIEKHILHILEQCNDLRSTTSIASDEYGSWPVNYHLSSQRSNLVRHLDFSDLDVLELGAGMGGVSRFLAESARTLTVVEGSATRYNALQARLRDLDNWQGQVANIQDVQLSHRYDVVCVVGVLEYSELYIEPDANGDSFDAFLRKAAGFLKEDGVLVLAIENKIGLKYWSGAAEDHTGRLFDSICNYPINKSPRTFSRKELVDKLKRAGFAEVQVQYPFPDYKMPGSILTDPLVTLNAQLAGNLACSEVFNAHPLPKINFFPDFLALKSVTQAGLLTDFSNSFLTFSSSFSSGTLNKILRRQREKGEVAWHYSSNRNKPTETVFSESANEIWVEKKALVQDDAFEKKEITRIDSMFRWHPIELQRVTGGEDFRLHLLQRAYYEEWVEFVDEFTVFLSWSFIQWKADHESAAGLLSGRALDAGINNANFNFDLIKNSRNMTLDVATQSGLFSLFDLEWSVAGGMSKSWFVLRNILNLGPQRVEFMKRNPQFNSFKTLYELLCEKLDIEANLKSDTQKESDFLVAANDKLVTAHEIEHAVSRVFPNSQFARNPVDEYYLRTQFKRLQQLLPAQTFKIAKRGMKAVRTLQIARLKKH